MAVVFLDGKFIPPDEAKVSVFDRGFLFGDGVYEVIPVYCGRAFGLDSHLLRLARSLQSIGIANPYSDEQWGELITELVSLNEGVHQGIYLQITRGAPLVRDHVMPTNELIPPTVFAMSRPILETLEDVDELVPITAMTRVDIRWDRCDIKSISLLGNVLLKQEVSEAGAKEAILIRDGIATEGAASNLFAVVDGVIRTAPADHRILAGITRDILVSLLHQSDLAFQESEITEIELANATEVWMTSSTREIMPVVALDSRPVGDGKIGPICRRAAAIYLSHKNAFLQGE